MSLIKLCQSHRCLGHTPISNKDGVQKIVSGSTFNCPDCGTILVPINYKRSYVENRKKRDYEKNYKRAN